MASIIRKLLGKSLSTDPDEDSRIEERDREIARLAAQAALPLLAALLDALADETETYEPQPAPAGAGAPPPKRPVITWDELHGYYRRRGETLAWQRVRGEMEAYIRSAQGNMRNLSDQLIARRISLAEWQLGMQREIKIVCTISGVLGRGGWMALSQADYDFLNRLTARQFSYLNKFAREIASGAQPLNGHLRRRSEMYAKAARGVFEEMRRRFEQMDNGKVFERRVLGAGEHCQTRGDIPGCVELAALGWQPIGTLPPIGESPCITNCKCHFDFDVVESV
jgi:hypothetical protein